MQQQKKVWTFCAYSIFDPSSFAPTAALTRVLLRHQLFAPHLLLSRQQWQYWGSLAQLASAVPLVLRKASNSNFGCKLIKPCYQSLTAFDVVSHNFVVLTQYNKPDRVGPVDNRPSTDKLNHFVKKKKCDLWHMTCGLWVCATFDVYKVLLRKDSFLECYAQSDISKGCFVWCFWVKKKSKLIL